MCAVFVIGRNGSMEGYIMKTKKVDSMLLAQLALLIAIEIIMKLYVVSHAQLQANWKRLR